MSVNIRGTNDKSLNELSKALEHYKTLHPRAEIKSRRQNNVSVRVRIVDPDFEGISRRDRHDTVWQLLEDLPDSVLSQISVLLLLTPEERATSFTSSEFDDPIRSKL